MLRSCVRLPKAFGNTSISCRISRQERANAGLRLRDILAYQLFPPVGWKLSANCPMRLSAVSQQGRVYKGCLELPLVLSGPQVLVCISVYATKKPRDSSGAQLRPSFQEVRSEGGSVLGSGECYYKPGCVAAAATVSR